LNKCSGPAGPYQKPSRTGNIDSILVPHRPSHGKITALPQKPIRGDSTQKLEVEFDNEVTDNDAIVSPLVNGVKNPPNMVVGAEAEAERDERDDAKAAAIDELWNGGSADNYNKQLTRLHEKSEARRANWKKHVNPICKRSLLFRRGCDESKQTKRGTEGNSKKY
jgi:hypothetical protein